MGYYLYDVNGYVADGPSIQGLEDFARWARGAIRAFIEEGRTVDVSVLVKALAGARAVGSVESTRIALLAAARKAEGVLILSDWSGEEINDGGRENQP
jgi:hypothetical protein